MIDEHDIDQVGHDMLPDDAAAEPASKPDPNSLGAILSEAVAEIDADGGREANLLKGVIGKQAFDSLPARKSTAQAWQTWRDAPPQSKPHRLLAIAIARAADKPHLVDRITREISDMDPFASGPGGIPSPPKAPPVKAQERTQKTYPRASTKTSPRDGYLQMLKLAEKSDATSYIRARSGER
jgi:hypothetical protein